MRSSEIVGGSEPRATMHILQGLCRGETVHLMSCSFGKSEKYDEELEGAKELRELTPLRVSLEQID